MADRADAAPAAAEIVVDLEEDAPGPGAPPEAVGGAGADDVVELPDDGGEGEDGKLPRHALPLRDGRVRLPLLHPVTLRIRRGEEVREERYEELTFRRLNGVDMRAVTAAGQHAAVVAIQRSCGVPALKFDRLYDRMDAADIAAASQVIGFFLLSGPRTGR